MEWPITKNGFDASMESMTAYMRHSFKVSRWNMTVQIRSVNHRFFELQLRCASHLTPLASELEKILRSSVKRGQLEVHLLMDPADGFQKSILDQALLQQYMDQAGRLAAQDARVVLNAADLLQLPGVISVESTLPAALDIQKCRKQFHQGINRLIRQRRKEGVQIGSLIRHRLSQMQKRVIAISQARHSSQRAQARSLKDEWQRMQASDAPAIAILEWLERQNIAEELDRLHLHIRAARSLAQAKTGEQGKELDFYCQEMLRETNTLASKSRDVRIRHLAVSIKTAIEEIKEQARNLV
ncbi:MAG: DUF1732 domain-containing protein [Leptospiraceae bacterium]|nr:DUF1732 domain-containing protein [Leptospiraceae bacterium]